MIQADARHIPLADESVPPYILAYIAGIVDGGGYIGIKMSQRKDMKSPTYQARIQIRMTDEPAIRFIARNLGGNYYPEKQTNLKRKPLYCFQASDRQAETILMAIRPYIIIKISQLREVLAFREVQRLARGKLTKVVGHGFYLRLKRLNKIGPGGDADDTPSGC